MFNQTTVYIMSKTTVHDLKDTCMIYNESWPIKFWNFTDFKFEKLKYVGVMVSAQSKPVMLFSTDTDEEMTTDRLRKILYQLPKEYDKAEVVVENHKNHHRMNITFSGSMNAPEEDRHISFAINYDDPKYRKWKRDLIMLWFKIRYKLTGSL